MGVSNYLVDTVEVAVDNYEVGLPPAHLGGTQFAPERISTCLAAHPPVLPPTTDHQVSSRPRDAHPSVVPECGWQEVRPRCDPKVRAKSASALLKLLNNTKHLWHILGAVPER